MKTIVFIHGAGGGKSNFTKLENELSKDFKTISFDLIGYGKEIKPRIEYNLNDFIKFVESKVNLKKGNYILVGHSMGGAIAKELALKYKKTIKKLFLIGYPLKDKDKLLKTKFQVMYMQGSKISKVLCHTKHLWKYFIWPVYFIFDKRNINSFWDYFNHTYHSLSSSVNNTIYKDNKENIKELKNKVVIIFGEKDSFLDKDLAVKFKHYKIKNLGHLFFGKEKEIVEIIRKESK